MKKTAIKLVNAVERKYNALTSIVDVIVNANFNTRVAS